MCSPEGLGTRKSLILQKGKKTVGCQGSWHVHIGTGLLQGPQKQSSPATGLESQIACPFFAFWMVEGFYLFSQWKFSLQIQMLYRYSRFMSYVKLNLCKTYKRETKVKRRTLVFFQTIVSVDLRRNYPGGQNLSGVSQLQDVFGCPRGKPLPVHSRRERNGCAAKSLFYYFPVQKQLDPYQIIGQNHIIR